MFSYYRINESEERIELMNEYNFEDDFDESLDEAYPDGVEIAGGYYYPSNILKRLDPIAYRCYLTDYVDWLLKDGEIYELTFNPVPSVEYNDYHIGLGYYDGGRGRILYLTIEDDEWREDEIIIGDEFTTDISFEELDSYIEMAEEAWEAEGGEE